MHAALDTLFLVLGLGHSLVFAIKKSLFQLHGVLQVLLTLPGKGLVVTRHAIHLALSVTTYSSPQSEN